MILVPLPDHPYYLWQALVQAVYLKGKGWPVTFLVYKRGPAPSTRLLRIMGAGLGEWLVWDEWRPAGRRGYNAAMKPWLVGKFLEENPHLVGEQLLILDPDALPLRQWPGTIKGVLYGTDTDSYTGPEYLQSKNAWFPLCELVGVDPDRAAKYRGVGAQYVTTGLPGAWWEAVAELSVEAFKLLQRIPVPPGDQYAVQAWCAEMYVTQLAAIRDGVTPIGHGGMNMVWANGPLGAWETHGFFHDAGQHVPDPKHLCKTIYQSSPWGLKEPLRVDPDSASAPYVDLIRQVEEQYPELTW